jgi:hypothetical protein
MTERIRSAGPPLALLAMLAVAIVVPFGGALSFAQPDSEAAEGFADVLEALDDGSRVLVAFDADLGTYAEIRPTVRAVLGELAEGEVDLVTVSLTPEGRALAIEERGRLGDAVEIGFIPGAEAALVRIAGALDGAGALGQPADDALRDVDLVLVVGGNDIGPRSWVEQVGPRVGSVPIAGISPTVLLPEVAPYVASGQLVASIANPRDGAALREALGPAGDEGPTPAAVLVGLVVAIAIVAEAVVRGWLRIGPSAAGGETTR